MNQHKYSREELKKIISTITITIQPEEILEKDDFISLVDSYPTIEDAILDGVGITHSFPPEGEVSAEWNMLIWSHL